MGTKTRGTVTRCPVRPPHTTAVVDMSGPWEGAGAEGQLAPVCGSAGA